MRKTRSGNALYDAVSIKQSRGFLYYRGYLERPRALLVASSTIAYAAECKKCACELRDAPLSVAFSRPYACFGGRVYPYQSPRESSSEKRVLYRLPDFGDEHGEGEEHRHIELGVHNKIVDYWENARHGRVHWDLGQASARRRASSLSWSRAIVCCWSRSSVGDERSRLLTAERPPHKHANNGTPSPVATLLAPQVYSGLCSPTTRDMSRGQLLCPSRL